MDSTSKMNEALVTLNLQPWCVDLAAFCCTSFSALNVSLSVLEFRFCYAFLFADLSRYKQMWA